MISTRLCVVMVFSLVGFSAIFKSGTGLLCYECNSHTNKNCSQTKPPNNTIVDCTEKGKTDNNKYTMCRKIHQTIDFEVNGLPPDNRVIRSCAWDDSQYKDACYSRSGFGGRQDACTCSKDLCNTSALVTGKNVFTLATLNFIAIVIGRKCFI